jgi:hypothetical protein
VRVSEYVIKCSCVEIYNEVRRAPVTECVCLTVGGSCETPVCRCSSCHRRRFETC